MSLSNAVFQFVSALVAASAPSDALYGADIHASLYEEIKQAKTIRVGDVQTSVPLPVNPPGAMREFNAFLTVQCVVRPQTKSSSDLIEARKAATAMALQLSAAIYDDEKLGNTVCDCRVVRKEDDWANAGTVRHAVSYLLLRINSR